MARLLDAVLERAAPRRTSRTRAGSAAGTCSPAAALISDGGDALDRVQPIRLRPVEPRDRAEQPPRVRVLRVVEELALRPRSTTRPAYITTISSATSATTPRSCVIMITAESKSSFRRPISSMICAWIVTSSAVVGSSAIEDVRVARRAPSRSSRAGACRPRTGAGSRRRATRDSGCRPAAAARPPGARRCALVDVLVRADRLDDLLADPVDRVQRRHRVLEDHRDLVAAVRPASPPRRARAGSRP